MKQILLYIVILAAIIGVTAAVTLKVKNSSIQVKKMETTTTPPPEFPKIIVEETVTKPNVFLGSLNKNTTSKGSPTPAQIPSTAVDFMKELSDTYNDGDAPLIESVQKDAASL